MLTQTERPLTDVERQRLEERLGHARRQASRALLKTGAASALVCGALLVVTMFASTAPVWVILLFWAALWALFTLWIGLPWRKLMLAQIPALEDALQTSHARVVRLQSTRVVEFEEEEDEGACYAFEDGPSSVFIVGQEFYEDDDFPNSDFSMIEVLGRHGTAVDVWLDKAGTKLVPERIIPAATKRTLELPEHLAVVPIPLERLEAELPRSSAASA